LKEHLNTLYVTTEGAYLAKVGETVAVRIEKKTRLQLPLRNLNGIICFGRIGVSPSLFAACAEASVAITFLSSHGKLLARVLGFSPGNVLLRRQQYRMSDSNEESLKIATSMVLGKVANCRTSLQRSARDITNSEQVELLQHAVKQLRSRLELVQAAKDLDQLRGIEGESANIYFGVFNQMLIGERDFHIAGRSRRPPMDPTNAVLSYLYTILSHDVRSACESVGLDSQVGFLHRDRPGRPSLALDLMEEFRPILVDRFVVTLINRRQITMKDFEKQASGGILLHPNARREILKRWQERKSEKVFHEFCGETVTLGLFPFLQARLLARYIRGDLDAYPPYFAK
jgi:CRISPR-associated protein Cas1